MAIDVGQFAVGRTSSGSSQATSAVNTAASGSTFYIFVVWGNGASFTSIADSKSNTYNRVGSATFGSMNARLYECVNGTGGSSHTATLTVSTNESLTVFLVEVTGGLTAGIVDQSDSREDTTSPFTLAAGLTTTQANELLLSFLAGDSTSNPATHAESGLGSSSIVIEETNGSAFFPGAIAKSYKTSTGTFNPSWTESGATDSGVWLVTLKEAASAPVYGTTVGVDDPQRFERRRRQRATGMTWSLDTKQWW